MMTSSEPVTSSAIANVPLGRQLLSVVDERDRLRQRQQTVLIAHPDRSRVGEHPGGGSRGQRRPVDRHFAAAFEQRQIAGGGDGAPGFVGGGLELEAVRGVGHGGAQAGNLPARYGDERGVGLELGRQRRMSRFGSARSNGG
jgi:hypothetical protein